MSWIHAVILGIVEGLTEFLPVSSTGHLILSAHVLGLPQTEIMKTFEIAIQVGAILAVVLVYWRSFLADFETFKRVLIAFVPTALIGFILYKLIKKFLFAGPTTVLISLVIGGIILIIFDRCYRPESAKLKTVHQIPYVIAAGIGLIQALAVIPGVSRAGATIVGALCLGTDRKTAVEFSFLLAVPTLTCATALDMFKSAPVLGAEEWKLLWIGGIASFFVALASIRFFLSFIQKRGFTFFGVYRIVLAALFWIFVK